MNWSSWGSFWAMGGYAVYVWGSFAVVALTLAVELCQLAYRRRRLRQRLRWGRAALEVHDACPNET
ncbi:heme exporter protein CcmD [Allopusillimonas ginsengisoli]|nr:heme exporter protein CcmD [Allopusillimonas ginsengisoli]